MKYLVPGLLLAACLFLGYRQFALEAALAELQGQLARLHAAGSGSDDTPVAAAAGDASGPRPGAMAPDAGAPDPLHDIEAQLAQLRGELESLERATGETATLEDLDTAVDEERILGIVNQEQARIRDRHLEFQREQWMRWRHRTLDAFAKQQGIGDEDKQAIMQILEEEADGLVEIMRQPDAHSDPARVTKAWNDQLGVTDRKARELLKGPQLEAWARARLIERRVMWPWLSDEPQPAQ
ncbi:MAG: hypothetical protein OEZ06_00025 [Myxococcales bacterium]|nr:hypothetical protein [Myxococcales bacterium]